MARTTGFWLSLAIPLGIVPFLPLYVARSMTRSFVSGSGGDIISYSLTPCTLFGFFDGLKYTRSEESSALFMALNLVLALAYAGALGLGIRAVARRISARRQRAG